MLLLSGTTWNVSDRTTSLSIINYILLSNFLLSIQTRRFAIIELFTYSSARNYVGECRAALSFADMVRIGISRSLDNRTKTEYKSN